LKFTIFILTAILSSTLYICGQTDSDYCGFFDWRSKKDNIKFVFNEIIPSDSAIFIKFYRNDSNKFGGASHVQVIPDSIMTSANIQYIFKQINNNKTKTVWQKKIIRKSKIIKTKFHKNSCVYFFSVPLFTEDKKYCIIIENTICSEYGGERSANLYGKTNDNKWKFIKHIYYEVDLR